MKGLLHSKRFKKNLGKWLLMYAGAMVIFTTVVTYSKYVSNLGLGGDNARITNFDVTISESLPEEKCTGAIDENRNCTTEIFRPTTNIPYEFTVNNDFEVKTLLVISINVDSNFEITKLEEISNNNEEDKILYQKDPVITDKSVTISNNLISITSELDAPNNEAKSYRVTVKYKYNEDTYGGQEKENIEVVKVGYSAKQIK